MKLTLVDEKKKSTITTEAEETKRNALLVNRVESERARTRARFFMSAGAREKLGERERERAKKFETSARSRH